MTLPRKILSLPSKIMTSIGIMENKMEAAILFWGYIGIVEKKTEAVDSMLGLYRDHGKENGATIVC